jgi:hypothetical protein
MDIQEWTDKFVSQQQNLEPEFQKILDENFWEMLA